MTGNCSASKRDAPALLFAAAVYICITIVSGKTAFDRAGTPVSFGQIQSFVREVTRDQPRGGKSDMEREYETECQREKKRWNVTQGAGVRLKRLRV